jgi:hypothetical protein
MQIRAVLQHNAAMSYRSSSHPERLTHAFNDQTRFSPPPFSFLLLSTSIPTSTPYSATQPKSRRKDLRCTTQTNDIIAIMPDLNTRLLQRSSSAQSPSIQNPLFPLQVTTNQPRPRPKAFPRARTHLSLLAYHSGPRIRAHSLHSPIKLATASPTPRPASIPSAYPSTSPHSPLHNK